MSQSDLNSLEKAITHLTGELHRMSLLKLKAIYPQVTDLTLFVLESNIRRLKSYLDSSPRLIDLIQEVKQLTENGQLKTDSGGVTSLKDSPPTGGFRRLRDDNTY